MMKAKVVRKTKGAGLSGVLSGLGPAIRQGVEHAVRDTQRLSKRYASKALDGEIRQELQVANDQQATGRVYTTAPLALLLEYGIGRAEPSSQEEGSPAGPDGPVEPDAPGNPQPFLQPAAFQNRDNNVEAVRAALQRQLRSH